MGWMGWMGWMDGIRVVVGIEHLTVLIMCYLLDPRFLAPHWQVEVISVAAPFVVHLLQALCLNLAVIVARWARRHLNKIKTRRN